MKGYHDGQCFRYINWIRQGKICQNSKFKIKQVKTKSGSILTGIGTQSIFGVRSAPWNSNQSITYSAYSGKIFKEGEGKGSGRKITDG